MTKITITPKKQQALDASRRAFLAKLLSGFGLLGLAAMAFPFLRSLSPNRQAQAQATLEVDLRSISPGQTKTVLWRGKPVFISHRTPAQIAKARAEDGSSELLDLTLATDAKRTEKPEWLIVMAICTHLGCVPQAGGKYGGWRCPCHGSQFDNSGRLRQGPASANLEIPPYTFKGETAVVIG